MTDKGDLPPGRDRRVAVIGIGCRLPGSRDHHEFFRNLCRGVGSVGEITPDRWSLAEFYSEDVSAPNKTIGKFAGLVDDPFTFDHGFFKMSPREAGMVDPQQRLLLEETWHCIEDAGVPLRELQSRRTSVYVGVTGRDHMQRAAGMDTRVDGHSFLGGFDCIAANRISQSFGLRGASMSIDAACASSLVAVHEGVEALLSRDTDYVLAGGVHLILHPWRYISYSKARMLSPDGKCKTFDKDANGFVPGEGIAMVLLCRLADAERVGAHVYGIIRGSAVNHGGHRLTITAPTVESQREVIRAAIERAGVDPATITYVEAHGTGTALGDPIEVEALTQAFRERTQTKRFCWLGAVKTNIGHLEPAAGVAGLIKVLMMLRARRVPPTLNVHTPNPLINFAETPFKLAIELADWRPAAVGSPLRAGVSAFGAGGVNAHLVVEEHRVEQGALHSKRDGEAHPFILSARTRESLISHIEHWMRFVREETFSSCFAADICHTLSTGREHFPYRIGRMVRSTNDIRSFLDAPPIIPEVIRSRPWWLSVGDVAPPKRKYREVLGSRAFSRALAALEDSMEGARGRSYLDGLRAGRRGAAERCVFACAITLALADHGFHPAVITSSGPGLYAGLAAAGILDWVAAAKLASGRRPSRLALRRPQIPFLDPSSGRIIHRYELSTHYFDAMTRGLEIDLGDAARALAKADLVIASQYAFRSHIEEWDETLRGCGLAGWTILRDGALPARLDDDRRRARVTALAIQSALDRVNRKWSLPRERILRDPRAHELLDLLLDSVISIDNVLTLFGGGEEQLSAVAEESRRRVHLLDPNKPYSILKDLSRRLDDLGDAETWLSRGLDGDGAAAAPSEAALLVIGGGAHPGRGTVLLDGSSGWRESFDISLLQLWLMGAEIRWDVRSEGQRRTTLSLPTYRFSGDIHLPLPAPRVPSRDAGADEEGEKRSQGEHLSPSASRAQALQPSPVWLDVVWNPEETLTSRVDREIGGSALVFHWNDDRPRASSELAGAVGAREVHVVYHGSDYREEARTFTLRAAEKADYERVFDGVCRQGRLPSRVVHLWSLAPQLRMTDDTELLLQMSVHSLFHLLQALMQRQPETAIDILFVYPHEQGHARPELAAVEGLARTVHRENPLLRLRMLAVDHAAAQLLWSVIGRELGSVEKAISVRYDGKTRLVKRFGEVTASAARTGRAPGGVKAGGVYLLTGGAGGVGLRVAEHLLSIQGVRIALAGRSPIGPALERWLLGLSGDSAQRVAYLQADVSLPHEARALVQAVRSRFGALSGVIHAAAVLRDSFLFRKTIAQVREVLAPKALGAINLDSATLDEPLDFFVLFSSIAAITGNIGQADYCVANSFLDAFAAARERLRAAGARSGRTISINWPVLEGGGMRFRDHASSMFGSEHGLVPMPVPAMLSTLDTALDGAAGLCIILYGNEERARRLLDDPCPPGPGRGSAPRPPAGEIVDTRELAVTYLKRAFSELLGVPAADVDPAVGLDEYGLDSILINQFNVQIERELGPVSKTILFECRTLDDVAAQLVRHRSQELRSLLAASEIATADDTGVRHEDGACAPPAAAGTPTGRRGSFAPNVVRPAPEEEDDAVAIIGMSGRYPMASEVDELWRNLTAARDCITEIPAERWDYRASFTDDPAEALDGRMYCKWGGFLEGADRFDPLFFNISPREAELMDPQERIFLEEVWHALEDAGYPPRRLARGGHKRRAVGVFAGVTTYSYLLWGPDIWRKGSRAIPTSMPWRIANRISWWLDLDGPSMPVDTACASALTAVHLACESLKRGECEMALVGAVNLYLHPSKYEWLCQMQMLSRKGRCHAFGDLADGFVPGEGVGVLVLKPFKAALANGDRILAKVKGSAVNHGGRTNGFTVPNPNAQAELVKAALRCARVDPRTIGYVEAHGTGTALGDPIEIAGLTKAFREAAAGDTPPGYCAIGSVKSNIGHLESAAGLAGLTKILLQLQHGKLAPTIHVERTNPRIDFAASPFRIQRTLDEWLPITLKEGGRERAYPRRAGISAFGAGGSNAHVIIEEHSGPRLDARGDAGGQHVVVLSAKNEERLREHCRRTVMHLRRANDMRVSEIAHELQVRREPLEERLALVVSDAHQLMDALDAFGAGRSPGVQFAWGNTKTARTNGDHPRATAERTVTDALAHHDAERLARAWTAGADIQWETLYSAPLRHVPLPGYPFAAERYWLPEAHAAEGDSTPHVMSDTAPGHPFLAERDASAVEPRFSVELTGDELFLADHVVDDEKIFPAVGYLEMARAAMAAVGLPVLRLRNNVWPAAISVRSSRSIYVELTPSAAGAGYEIFSVNQAGTRVVHGQGTIDAGARDRTLDAKLDLSSISARCTERMTGAAHYARLRELGLRLGPAYQGIQELRLGEAEALSEIQLPARLRTELDQFFLHPSILDSALQGSLGVIGRQERLKWLYLPFTIGEVEVFGPTIERCFAHVVLRSSTASSKKFEVVLAAPDGRVIVRIRDLWLRPWQHAGAAAPRATAPLDGVFFRPGWADAPTPAPASPAAGAGRTLLFASSAAGRSLAAELRRGAGGPTRSVIVVTPGDSFREEGPQEYRLNPASSSDFKSLVAALGAAGLPRDIVFAWPHGGFTARESDVRVQLDAGLFPVFHLLRALLRAGELGVHRLLFVFPGADGGPQPCYEAVGGLLRTACRESPRHSHALLELPDTELEALTEGRPNAAGRAIVAELDGPWVAGQEIRYRDERRQVKQWREHQPEPGAPPPLRRHGAYIVTGGAGGLGVLVARSLVAPAGARVVLTGRSPADARIDAVIRDLRAAGGDALYVRADVSRADEAAAVVAAGRSAFGAIRGVVHSAGVLRDGLLATKDEASLRDVLAPKVWGAINIDESTSCEPLDFFVLFSSVAGVLGSIGQGDYAFANRFLDAFAEWREALRRLGRRAGKSLSLGWPLWRDGGMQVDDATAEALRSSFGFRPLEAEAGIAAFLSSFGSPAGSMVFIPGDAAKVRRLLGVAEESRGSRERPAPAGGAHGERSDVRARLRAEIVRLVAEQQKLDKHRVDPERSLAEYGFDSISFTRLANQLNKDLGVDVTPATFFEYTTGQELTDHLMEAHAERIAARLPSPAEVASDPAPPSSEPASARPTQQAAEDSPERAAPYVEVSAVARPREPIAIVGMHGMMPQSDDLAEFWQHLDNGRDLVTEIPAERWDWREHWGDPLREPNKTNSKWGGFLRCIDRFDARFFGISPREAELMDPQQRIFLETAYKAIEEAGYAPSDLSQYRTGVFVGVGSYDYYDIIRQANVPVDAYTTTGTFHAILANRVSFLLNLRGPSFPIDTACSSSHVALRAAIESLWAGSCDVALAGGVNLIVAPMVYISFARAGMLSPDGRCKTFDKDANGYVRGEGAGAVLLKPLSRAIADGDHIHAVIRGSAVNHGGRVNTLTTPNPNAQAELIIQAFDEGGVDPSTVRYMEVHGTGTALGDPIEVNGLKKAFRELRRRAGMPELVDSGCGLGSVKTNIGHLEPAAGMAGIFKVILAMKHGRIPGNLHITELNPYINVSGSPFHVVRSAEPWPRVKDDAGRELPRRGGVSSFGFGGANGHILLEEHIPPRKEPSMEDEREHVFVLSARTEDRLREYARIMGRWLSAERSGEAPVSAPVEGAALAQAALAQLERDMVLAAAEILGVQPDEISPDDPLEDIGFDAFHWSRLWERISSIHGVARGSAPEANGHTLSSIARHVFAAGPDSTRARSRDGASLAAVAYTLQVGREAMEHRIAVIAGSAAELARKLSVFADLGRCVDGVFAGRAEQGRGGRAMAEPEPVAALLARRDLRRLGELWVAGEAVDWTPLYGEIRPQRASLPTYPFARTPYWVRPRGDGDAPAKGGAVHPLLIGLAGVESLGEGLTFRARLAPSDRIVSEHRVHGRAVFPGVGHLEMARAALTTAREGRFRLTSVIWREPLDVGDAPQEVLVRLRGAGDRTSYEIRSVRGDSEVLFSQGACEPFPAERAPLPIEPIDTIVRRCPRRVDGSTLYQALRSIGLEYGPYFQGIREVWIGGDEALARVGLQDNDRGELASYLLHPTLMDAALQTVLAITHTDPSTPGRAWLPFSVEAVEMIRPLTAAGYAHARATGRHRFDVMLLDEHGSPAVVLREVYAREEHDPFKSFFFVPTWESAPVGAASAATPARGRAGACLIVHPPGAFGIDGELARRHGGSRVLRVVLGAEAQTIADDEWLIDLADPGALLSCVRAMGSIRTVYFLGGLLETHPSALNPDLISKLEERGVMSLFRLVKALGALDKIQGVQALKIVVNDAYDAAGRCSANPAAAALTGLSKALANEYPHVEVACLDIGVPVGAQLSDEERASITDAILAEPAHRAGEDVVLLAGSRHVRRLLPATLERSNRSAFRRRGTYVIIGGAGGIGARIAEHLVQTVGACLVLVGRRAEGPEIARSLDALRRSGGLATYLQADVTDLDQMRRVLATVSAEHGTIHGVFHAGMVLEDGITDRMDEATFRAVLAPKVAGSAVLGELLRHERLDFMMFLSSVQSFIGAAGQGNYAAACSFQDAFVHALASRVPYPVKVINWGFWGTVGRVATEAYRARLAARGFRSISPEEGMEAIERILVSDERQVVAIRADDGVLVQIGVQATGPGAAPLDLPHIAPLSRDERDEAEESAFNAYISHALLLRLQQAGVLRRPGERIRRADLSRALGALTRYHRLVASLARILARHRLVVEEGDELIAADAVFTELPERALSLLPEREAALCTAYPNIATRVRLVSRCLSSLREVISGSSLATEVMFPDASLEGLASIYRGEKLVAYCNHIVAESVRAFVGAALRRAPDSTPIRVLEIGGGTGGTTLDVLDALRGFEQQVTYDFTDLSVRFLQHAEQTLGGRFPGLSLRTLDIERPLDAQGYADHEYDLVIAANVMHATRDLDAALRRARRLLKDGGWLVLNEVTRTQDFHTVTFGLLDGWWLDDGDGERQELSPLLDVEMWRRRLRNVGFRRVAALGSAADARELSQRVIVAERGPSPQFDAPADAAGERLPGPMVSEAQARRDGGPMTSEPHDSIINTDFEGRLAALIADAASACLGTPAAEIDVDKPLSSFGVDSIVGVELVNRINQALGIVLKTIVIFDYPTIRQLSAHVASTHGAALAATFAPRRPATPPAAPAREVIIPHTHVMDSVPRRPPRVPRAPEAQPSADADHATTAAGFRAVRFERPGNPSDLRIVPIEPTEVGPGEVEILVKAFPINFSDFLLAKGLYPIMPEYPFTPGVEVSGVVRRIGPGVTRIAVGDEVIGLTRPEMGGQASVVVTDDTFVVKKPPNVTHEEACGMPVAFLAMYVALERAQLQAGERVLIHAATGTNGVVAVQLARLAGAEIYATAGSGPKIDHLRRMGVHNAINYRDVDFAEEILRLTRGEGVDVIINTIGGDALQKGLDILAPEGRYVEIAVFGLQASKGVNLSRFVNNQTFYSFNAKKFFLKHQDQRTRYLDLMASYIEAGKVRPTVSRVFTFDQVVEAYAAKADRETIGRIVVSLDQPARGAVEEAGRTATATRPVQSMDIAIIGMSCRFPGARDVHQFWDMLARGESAVREVPASRWSSRRYFDPDPRRLDRTYCKRGGFLDDVDSFDAGFFNISGKEAAQTDPQQRLFLEEAWSALEDAGYSSAELSGKSCGVFVGAGASDYLARMSKAGVIKEAQSFWGNEASILAARISYFLNLKGASVSVNTACSSSLVALHLACQSILTGDSEMALAGGVFLAMIPDYFIVASNGNMLSPDGRCKTFDESADGFGPGEGVGVVVLKPLHRALADGDHVAGIINGTAINQDGKTNGITAPSSLSQTAVELAVYRRFGVNPETISYVEAHGTGTKLGDPIEIEALTRAFRGYTQRNRFCRIGSVKTNIGHTAAAAGVAGVIKVLLSFKHRQIPASLNFHEPNRHIDFDNTPFIVNTELAEWTTMGGVPRRAAVSSFGFSGTNAHVVLEESPPVPRTAHQPRDGYVVPLSAATEPALERRFQDLLGWLGREGEGAGRSLAEISHHLQVHRDHFARRAAFVVRDKEELTRCLMAALGRSGGLSAQPAAAATGGAAAELAARYMAGEQIDWARIYAGERYTRIPMPTYPFDRDRYWFTEDDTTYSDVPTRPEPGIRLESIETTGDPRVHRLRMTLTGSESFIEDHRIAGAKVVPAAVYLEIAYAAANVVGISAGAIRDFSWLRRLTLHESPVDIVATVRPFDHSLEIEIGSSAGGEEVVHARGIVVPRAARGGGARIDLSAIRESCTRSINRAEHYEHLRALGIVHGPALAAVEEVRVGSGEALGRLVLPVEARRRAGAFRLDPALVDGAFQLLGAFQARPSGGSPEQPMVPFSVEEMEISETLGEECFAHVVAGPRLPAAQRYNVRIVDVTGRVLVEMRDFMIKARSGAGAQSPSTAYGELLDVLQRLESGEMSKHDAARFVEVMLER